MMTATNVIDKKLMYNNKSVKRWISSLRSIATDMLWSNVDINAIRQIESIANRLETEDNDDRQYLSEKIASSADRKD